MDAVTGALLSGVPYVIEQRQGNGGGGPLLLKQLVVGALHIGQTVDVEFEDSGAYCAQMPSPVQRSWSIQTSSASSCAVISPAVPAYVNQMGPTLTGVDRLDDTTVRFLMLLGGYPPEVRTCARVKIGHAPTVFSI